MVSWVRGISESNMEDLSKTIFNDILLPSVRKEARDEIEFHRQNNGFVVILSSALNYICREMATHLNVDDIVSSEFEIEDGILTGRPKGRLCFGDEKRVRLEEYCAKTNANPSEAWYYGDSISDLAVLSSVGNPVCVTPDKYLRKEALKRGWKILDWGS